MIETILKMFHLHDNIAITDAQVLVDTTYVTPPLVIFLCSNDHIFCLQNIKPRYDKSHKSRK